MLLYDMNGVCAYSHITPSREENGVYYLIVSQVYENQLFLTGTVLLESDVTGSFAAPSLNASVGSGSRGLRPSVSFTFFAVHSMLFIYTE